MTPFYKTPLKRLWGGDHKRGATSGTKKESASPTQTPPEAQTTTTEREEPRGKASSWRGDTHWGTNPAQIKGKLANGGGWGSGKKGVDCEQFKRLGCSSETIARKSLLTGGNFYENNGHSGGGL